MARLRSMSIRKQIIVLIILMTLMPMGIIIYTAYQQQQHDIDEAVEMTGSVTRQIHNDQKGLLAGAEQLASIVSAMPAVRQRDTAAVNILLAELVKANPLFTNIIIADRSGSLWASAVPFSGAVSIADRRHFRNALATGKMSSGEYNIGRIKNTAVLGFAYPVTTRAGEVTDILGIFISLDTYSRLYSGHIASPVSSILLTDHKGTILFSSVDQKLAGKQDRPDLFNRMTEGAAEGSFEAKGNLGIARIFSYRKLWLNGETTPYLYIRTGLDKEYVLAKARRDFMLGVGTLLPAMLCMLGTALWFCRRNVLGKIKAIQDATQRITRGDLEARVPDHTSGGELGDLGVAFNKMAERLQSTNRSLQESEVKYRELVDNAASIIMKVDIEGNITFFNEYAQRFFGFSQTEILHRSVVGTIVPATESTGRNLAELVRDIFTFPDAHQHVINENICNDGKRVWVSWNNHPLIDEAGNKIGILSIGQDITELIRIERELQKSEHRFRSFVENANDIVFALTPEGVFSYVSPNWVETFGYSLDETIGKPFMPFVHPEDIPACLEILKRALETGEKQSGVEYRVRHKDGSLSWYKANGSVTRDIESDSTLFIGIGRDISELKKAAATLLQSEEKFSTIFSASPDAIILFRFQDGLILDVNEGFSRITGYSAEEAVGRTSQELGLWSDTNDRHNLASVVAKRGEIKNFEAYLKRKDTSGLLAQISARIIEVDGVECLLSIIRDITEREHLLRELVKAQKLESISILAGGIAHNFNNVITGVIGYITYAKKHLDEPENALITLEAAEKSAYRAAGIARQLLSFSQNQTPAMRPISVDSLVRESVSLFLSSSNVRGIIDCASHQTISVDSLEINQAFNNIVLNAIHAMPDGGTLSVRVDSCALDDGNQYALAPGDYVRIDFEDTGCGIAKEALTKVFDPYFTTKDSGTGLGLSSTHSIIKKHGGHIEITSEVDKGTTVTVLLPSSRGPVMAEFVASEQTPTNNAGALILVMDDEEVVLDFAEELLKDMGYRVVTCVNGEEACGCYREYMEKGTTFSVVILDLSIQNGMDGMETARRILDINPYACLIASSGHQYDPAIVEYRSFGFCGSIAKPYSSKDLAVTIENALSKCCS